MEHMWNLIIQDKNGNAHYNQDKLDLILRCLNDNVLLQETSKQLSVGVDPLYLYINYFKKIKSFLILEET